MSKAKYSVELKVEIVKEYEAGKILRPNAGSTCVCAVPSKWKVPLRCSKQTLDFGVF